MSKCKLQEDRNRRCSTFPKAELFALACSRWSPEKRHPISPPSLLVSEASNPFSPIHHKQKTKDIICNRNRKAKCIGKHLHTFKIEIYSSQGCKNLENILKVIASSVLILVFIHKSFENSNFCLQLTRKRL